MGNILAVSQGDNKVSLWKESGIYCAALGFCAVCCLHFSCAERPLVCARLVVLSDCLLSVVQWTATGKICPRSRTAVTPRRGRRREFALNRRSLWKKQPWLRKIMIFPYPPSSKPNGTDIDIPLNLDCCDQGRVHDYFRNVGGCSEYFQGQARVILAYFDCLFVGPKFNRNKIPIACSWHARISGPQTSKIEKIDGFD